MDFGESNNNLLHANYNEEEDCVIFGTKNGFYVYTLYPQKKIISQKITGGVSKICMLHRSNMFFFVGNLDDEHYNKSIVHIWDDNQKKTVGQIQFNSDIQHMQVYSGYIIISTKDTIYIYHFDNLQLLHTIPTNNNEQGLFKTCIDKHLLIYPDNNKMIIYNWLENEKKEIECHNDYIELFTITKDASYIATCSKKGSLIRIFSIETLELITELRRGTDYVQIVNLSFNKDNSLLLCSSDKGTIHVFSLEDSITNIQNKKIYGISYIKSVLPAYFDSQWSFSQIYLKNIKTYNVFSKEKYNIISVASNGCFYILTFDTQNSYSDTTNKHILSTFKFLSDNNDPFDNRTSTIL
jgi:WD40 repeat protein|tara:strand:+ start:930 stop:1985 length:1056 start_codon:yes stop_codon:yes gene_type:complete